MKKVVVLFILVMSGIAITVVYGMTLLMRKISIYHMNHMGPVLHP